jgi:hypothetical protein
MFIFGSGIDQVANQRNVADQQNIGLAQSDQAARQRAIDIGQQRQMQAQQEEQARQDAQFQFAQQQAASQAADQKNDFRFNLGRQDEATARTEDTRRFNVGVDLQKQQIAAGKGQADYSEAINAIENGDVSKPEDLDKSFGGLSAIQKQRALMYLSMKSKKQTQDYQSVMAAANAATGTVAPVFTPVTPVKPHWWSSTPEAPKPPPPLTEDEAMAKLAAHKQFLKFIPALTFDEATQKFMPAIPKPEGWQPTSGPAPVTAPPAAAPAPGGFAFNTATPQPTTVTAGTQPLGNAGLAPGTVYKGYTYQGGDPKDPKNWAPVTQMQ